MQLDAKKLQQLRSLEEAELSALILRAAGSMGIGERKARLLARQSGKLQKKLQGLSDAELQKLFSLIGEEQGASLFAQL